MSLPELVENVLITGDCANVSSFSEQVSGAPNQSTTKSYGFFKRPGTNTTFPFESGIILTTGNAFQAGNTVDPPGGPAYPDNPNGLPGDSDLEAALGQTNTNDATFIKFEFVPTSPDFNFRFIMASEEYDGGTECQFADSFAFLLKDVTSPNYQNLAVLPDGTPVSVFNINNASGCAANVPFFEGYDLGDTNYGGRTVVLTASATVIPNRTYEIKLVVADQGDSAWDSAIFLEAGSFNIGLDLGPDLTIADNNAPCTGVPYSLSTNYPNLTHTWYLDGTQIMGETTNILDVSADGTYSVEVLLAAGCTGADEIIIEFAENPVIANQLSDLMICDDNNDGFFSLDLLALNPIVYGTQSSTDFTITYHSTQTDADNNTTALATFYTNTVAYQQEEIFVRIENNIGTQCFVTDSFLLDVFDSAMPNDVEYRLCDTATDGDDTNGFVQFDLSMITVQVINPQNAAQFNISYHANQTDAIANVSALPLLYTNGTANAEQLVVRMENVDNSNCYVTALIDLFVDPLPVVTPIVDLRQCDDDTDGITQFNLTEANTLISSDAANETFTYYLTQADALGGLVTNQIINFTAYQNTVPLIGTVYSRIETTEGCWRTAQIDLSVGTAQIPTGFNLNYEVCDNTLVDGDNTNGIASFDFSGATAQVEALFPMGQNIQVTYYTNVVDALAEINAIPDISDHRNETSPNSQNIFVRVDSGDVNACLGLGERITLTVNTLPSANPIVDYVLCSDTNETDFDLATKDTEVIGGQPQDILVSYHRSLADAQTNTASLVSPFTNESNPQTIYVRAQFDDNVNGIGEANECVSTDMSFQLQVIPNPVITIPDPIRICTDQVNTVNDLTIRENQIVQGDGSIVLSYFETQADLDNNNSILDPTAYTSTVLDNTIIVLATGTNGCMSTATLELKTILYALLDLVPDAIEECEIDGDGFDEFDLTRSESQILNGLNALDFVFSYYILEADAIAGNTNSISDPLAFVNTQNTTQTIYVRIEPAANECFQIAPINLQVNRVPEIQIEDEYVLCLDRNNNVVAPENITLLPNPPINTQLNDTEYSFEWYQGDAIPANLIAGETGPSYIPILPGDYAVIATNLITGCTIPATTMVIGSYPPESITIEVITPAFSDDNMIEITVEGIGIYEYSLNDDSWQDSPIFADLQGGEHTVSVRDTLNCGQVFTMFIVIDYPKFFTPNGDGYNDTWNLKGIADQPNAKIYIFDRYGKLLKQLSPSNNGWDGTFNGEEVPSTDYWFTVEFIDPIDNTMKIFKAHFTLKR